MPSNLALDLANVAVEPVGALPTVGDMSLESLMSGMAMNELAASVLPAWCCSCSVPCCCCCP